VEKSHFAANRDDCKGMGGRETLLGYDLKQIQGPPRGISGHLRRFRGANLSEPERETAALTRLIETPGIAPARRVRFFSKFAATP
jgi:hypothetical protein